MKWAARLAAPMAVLLWGWLSPGDPSSAAGSGWELRADTTGPKPANNPAAPASLEPTAGDFLALQQRYVSLFAQIQPAVVQIFVTRAGDSKDGTPTVYLCTGFFVGRDGSILTTNAHLLNGAERVWFEQDGIPYAAQVAGIDLVTDLALLRAAKLPNNFSVISLSDSPDLPPIGTMLLAVTCKRGNDPGPSPGLVEGYNTDYGDQPLPTLHLRTSIAHDGGEGGSPVFDLEGRLVGIMVAALPETRSSLVLPARAAQRVREDLLNHGSVRYGRFGFLINQFVTAETGPQVLIKSVEYGGPAANAGLRIGDMLLSIGGTPIHTDRDLRQIAFFAHPGEFVAVRVRRDGRDVEMPLEVGEMSLEAPAAPSTTPDAGSAPGLPLAPTTPPPHAPPNHTTAPDVAGGGNQSASGNLTTPPPPVVGAPTMPSLSLPLN